VYGGSETANDKDSTTTTDTTTTPRADANPDVRIPIMEWWDVELLPTKLKKQVTMQEGQAFKNQTKAQLQHLSTSNTHETTAPEEEEEDFVELQTKCLEQASLSYSKTAQLVQHIVPISTNKQLASQQPVLYLTKKERRRQRRLRRVEKQRELQDLQAAGLIPPPEPRLTLKNFIRVMGDQAFVDPSQMEKKLQEQMHARQEAHLARNASSRLTKEQRSAKLARKLKEDSSSSVVSVALFWVKDMSHPYHRAKVELNARQYNITGGVLECGGGGGGEHNNPNNYIACVICEGGPKAIKRFTRLMLVRMKWTGTTDDDYDDNVEEHEQEEDGEKDQDGEYKTHKVRCEMDARFFFLNSKVVYLHLYIHLFYTCSLIPITNVS
jgi:U4/U6 small nuclear ribonucleoprotein PRP3